MNGKLLYQREALTQLSKAHCHAFSNYGERLSCLMNVLLTNAAHVLTACPIHRVSHGARGLTVLDDETRCWLNNTTARI